MKPVLLLSILLCAACAAPAEQEDDTLAAAEVQSEQSDTPSAPAARFNFCPDGWFMFDARCYKFIHSPMNWYNAEEHCNTLGGHLASATSPAQYNFLQQMTQTADQSVAWLGGFNLQGQWMWIDRQGFYYTNWYTLSSSSLHPCIFLRSAYGWSNSACSSGYRFICSKNPFGC